MVHIGIVSSMMALVTLKLLGKLLVAYSNHWALALGYTLTFILRNSLAI